MKSEQGSTQSFLSLFQGFGRSFYFSVQRTPFSFFLSFTISPKVEIYNRKQENMLSTKKTMKKKRKKLSFFLDSLLGRERVFLLFFLLLVFFYKFSPQVLTRNF